MLEEGFLKPQTHHSQAIGLWGAQSLLNASDGTLSVEESDAQEMTV